MCFRLYGIQCLRDVFVVIEQNIHCRFMARKNKSYVLGGKEFKTWTNHVCKECQRILSDGVRELTGYEALFAEDLLDYHVKGEQRKSKGIVKYMVRFPHAGNGFCFAVEYKNGEVEDFSYKKCKATLHKNPEKHLAAYKNKERQAAYRDAVRKQTNKYYDDSEDYVCSCCGAEESRVEIQGEFFLIDVSSKMHVDHVIPFVQLINDFEQSFEFKEYPKVLRREGNHQDVDYFSTSSPEDKSFVEAWQDYHRQNARLQLLCNSCNSSKGSKRKDGSTARYQPKKAA